MKQNTLSLIGMFTLLFLIGFTSASTITGLSNGNVSELSDSYSFNFNISAATDLTLSASTNVSGVSISLSSTFYNASNGPAIITGTVSGTQFRGKQNIVVTVSSNDSTSSSFNLAVSSVGLCKTGINGTDITNLELKDDSGLDNDWEWKPYDSITLQGRLRNNGDNDNEDYVMRVYFFENGKDVSDQVADDDGNLEENVNNLDSGKRSTSIPFNFKVSGDIDSGTYDVYVKAFKDGKESAECTVMKLEDSISIDKQSRQVIVKDAADVSGSISNTANCGEEVTLTAKIINIGEDDEDQVKVVLYNSELGLNLYKEITNLNSGESTDVTFSFVIPQTAQERTYKLTLSTEYNYDSDNEVYDDQSDSEDDLIYSITTIGDGCAIAGKPTISARLNSTAMVGEDLTILISLKNNLAQTTPYILSANGYDSWATFTSLEPSLVSLAKQESKIVALTLKPTQQGQQTFNIKTTYNGKTVDQPVTITVKAAQMGFFGKMIDQYGATTTWLVTAIVALVVLIVVILLIKALAGSKRD